MQPSWKATLCTPLDKINSRKLKKIKIRVSLRPGSFHYNECKTKHRHKREKKNLKASRSNTAEYSRVWLATSTLGECAQPKLGRVLWGPSKEVSQARLAQNVKRETFKRVWKGGGDCQTTLKTEEKICIAMCLGTTVNTRRKRSVLQDYKNLRYWLRQNTLKRSFINIHYLSRQTGSTVTPSLQHGN